ncbi:MAG: DMT family transporter [Candidatus Micrarchaeia archaeon]
MPDLLPAIGSLVFFGASSALTKHAVNKAGRHKAIVYGYIVTVILLWAGSSAFGGLPLMPAGLICQYIVQVVIGTVAVIAFFKAIEHGSSSIMAVLGESYVIIVLAAGIMIYGEQIGILGLAGASIVIAASTLVSIGEGSGSAVEPGVGYMALAVICWGYYYTYIKVFVSALGAYGASLLLETGIMALVVAYYLVRRKDLSVPERSSYLPIVLRGGVVFAATLCYSFSVDALGAGLTSAVGAGGPIVTAVLAYFMFGERLGIRKYAGITLLVIGLVLIANQPA